MCTYMCALHLHGRSHGRRPLTKVVCSNLVGRFALDVSTLLAPAAFDFYIASDAGASELTNLSVLRTVRVVRLIKVVRLVRASRLYKRWQAYMSLSYASETILQVILMILITCHWYACIIMLQATLHQHAEQTWLGSSLYGYCSAPRSTTTTDDRTPPNTTTFSKSPVLPGCKGLTLGTQYLASFSWSVMVITGMGGTDFYPSPASDVETAVVTALVLMAAIIWTIILAKFCNVATNSDPSLTYFYQKLDDLNRFTTDNNVPKEMGRRLREYLLQQKEFILRDSSAQAIPMLSTALQIEVVLECNRHWLSGIWFLRDLEEICLVRVCSSLVSKTLAPGELAPRRYLYVVKRGFVLFGGRVLSAGACTRAHAPCCMCACYTCAHATRAHMLHVRMLHVRMLHAHAQRRAGVPLGTDNLLITSRQVRPGVTT